MKLVDNELYLSDVKAVSEVALPWDKLANTSMLISGATGMIGSFLIDVIMFKNLYGGMNCRVYALGRNEEKAKRRFGYCWDANTFKFISSDINKPLLRDNIGKVEYVLHLASNTHPVAYASDPIGTIATNVVGTQNMLDFAVEHDTVRFMFASSVEIYGENRGDVEKFDESYCGYIDCNALRAGYPESKRCGEALCQAYLVKKGLDIVIPRLPRTYGPTMLMSDSKAISQFILKAVNGDDIVLKSAGTQYYSYTYVADAVSGLLTVLLKGASGEAYNIADGASDIMLKDLAAIVAKQAGKKVVFDLPDELEATGYSKATKARLDSEKLQGLGWQAQYDIAHGVVRTVKVLSGNDFINE